MIVDRPDALVRTEWLAARLGNPGLVVLDGTFMMPGAERGATDEFHRAHIPGARFFDIDRVADRRSPLPHMVPDPAEFGAAVGALGVGNNDLVVVYDRDGTTSGARVWWMFRLFGHDRVAVLDGGLPKWQAEGRPLETGVTSTAVRPYGAGWRPALLRTRAQMCANLDSRAEQIVDARSADRFTAAVAEPWPGRRRGHIPGSLNLPFVDLLDPRDKTLLPAAGLAEQCRRAGLQPGKPIVTTCGSGVTACIVSLALFVLGEEAAVYDGSWAEWGLPGPLPVAAGAARSPGV